MIDSLTDSRRRRNRRGLWLSKRIAGVLAAVVISFFMLTASIPVNAEPPAFDEYTIKAGFLFNFAKFVEWPAEVFKDPQSPMVICIIGKDPFGSRLDVFENKTIAGRRLVIRRVSSVDQAEKCHICFIGRSEREQLPAILKAIRNRKVLTISETQNFCRAGGVINLFLDDDKVRFEINIRNADKAGLKMSSQLLNLARICREDN